MIRKAVIFIICLIANLTLTNHVKADEIVVNVNGNGSGSTNQVQVTSQNTTQVSQNNDASVTNNTTSPWSWIDRPVSGLFPATMAPY